MLNIEIAKKTDIDAIMKFIELNWDEGHISGKDRSFFEYEFLDKENLNFVLTRKIETGEITGICGFMKSNAGSNPDIWTTIWRVLPNTGLPMLGMSLLLYIKDNIPHRGMMASGMNEEYMPVFDFLGMRIDSLKQYYILNSNLDFYEIALLNTKEKITNNLTYKAENKLVLIEDINELREKFDIEKFKHKIPYKDFQYLEKRFFKHPYFMYQVFGIKEGLCLKSVLVCRENSVGKSKVLRIVDFIGDETDIICIKNDLLALLDKHNYEYIDFIQYGIEHDILIAAGFSLLDVESDDIIIPHYFAPFVRKNIKKYFFIEPEYDENYYIFKADGDQDRPRF